MTFKGLFAVARAYGNAEQGKRASSPLNAISHFLNPKSSNPLPTPYTLNS